MKTKRLLIALLIGLGLTLGLFTLTGLAAPGNPLPDPPPNSHTAPLSTTISISYDEPISAAMVTSRTFAIHGMQSGLVTATHGVSGGKIIVTPTRPFHQGELVYAIATTRTLNVTGTGPLSATQWQFHAGEVNTRCVAGFSTDTTASANLTGVYASSVAWGDYDNDGDLDILLTGHDGIGFDTIVYENRAGIFTDTTVSANLANVYDSSVTWGDYDNDGDLDILLTGVDSGGNYSALVYENQTGIFITDTTASANLTGVGSSSVAWGDYDNDGDLDILLTGRDSSGGVHALVYENQIGVFITDTAASANLTDVGSSSVAWGDYDDDGDLDILLTGSGDGSLNALVYENRAGVFITDTTASANLIGVHDGSIAWGDYDSDGDIDILLTGFDSGFDSAALVYENQAGVFITDTTASANLTGVGWSSVAWGDYDNDGDLDILLTGQDSSGGYSTLVYENQTGVFITDTTASANLTSVYFGSVAWGDYDNDGDLDILLTGYDDISAYAKVYRNDDCPTPDLEIVKSVIPQALVPAQAVPGQPVTYTIAFSNSGTGIATHVVITDAIPVSVTVGNVFSSGVAITDTGVSPAYVWNVADLAPGAGGVITISGMLNQSLPTGLFSNTATITTIVDSDLDNNGNVAVLMVYDCYASPDDGATIYASSDAQAVRDAVAAANAGGTVKVGGTCAGVDGSGRVVYVNKDLILRGGYTPDDWSDSDPDANPTTLDAQNGGRVVYLDSGDVTLENARITGGNIAGNGGGIYVYSATLTLSNTVVASNTAEHGGGVCVHSGSMTLNGGQIIANTALGDWYNGQGGGVYVEYGNTTLNSGQIISNTASEYGGGMYVESGNTTLSGGQISHNTAEFGFGGGMYVESGNTTLSGGQITANNADYGGGMYVGNGNTTLNSGQIANNTAHYHGGGVLLIESSATLDVNGGQIVGNSADQGGGVHVVYASITMSAGDIISNTTPNSGGGVFIFDGNMTMSGGRIISNTATQYGGGVSVAIGSMTLDGGQIIGNTAGQGAGQGGGLCIAAGSVTMNDGEIVNNSATTGGGVFIYGDRATFEMNGGQIASNNVDYDGYNPDYGGGVYISEGSMTMSGGQIISNTAYIGGGMYVYVGSVTLDEGQISNNSADTDGGGMYVTQGSVTLRHTQITHNSAVDNGGGIYNDSSTLNLENSTWSHNTSDNGGALYNNDGTATLIHVTIVSNTASSQGDGLYRSGGAVVLQNSIVAANGAQNCYGGVTSDGHNLDSGDTCGFVAAGDQQNTDPLLGPLADNGGGTLTHALLPDSPAIDAGVCLAGVTTDQRGQTRPNPISPFCDVGAYESTFSNFVDLVIVKTVTPTIIAPGDALTYTLIFSNTGPNGATGVVITDVVPVSVTVGSVISSGVAITDTGVSPAYVWNVADLASGVGGVITISGYLSDTLPDGHTFSNTASIAYTETEVDDSNNSDSAGVTVQTPEITVSPLSLVFGGQDVDAGATVSQTVTITNDGMADLNFGNAITLTGTNTDEFTVESDTGENPLTPGSTRAIQVSFDPSSVGAKSASLTVQSDDGDEGLVNVVLGGTGIDQEITVSPLSLSFGDQDVDAEATVSQTVFITNDGTADLNLSTITLTGSDATEFIIKSDTGENPLTPGGTRAVRVSFDPSSAGAKSASLTVQSDDGDEGLVNVALNGTGTAPANVAPVADARDEQSVVVSALVTLDGSGSYDPDGHTPLAYGWTQTGGPSVILSSAAISQPTFGAPGAPATLTFTLSVTDARGLADPSPAEVVVVVTQPYAHIYLPLLTRNHSAPVTFPTRITDAIPARQAAYQGEVFYVESLHMPDQLPPGGQFYFSSQQDVLAPAIVDDALVILLDGSAVFTHTFSTNSAPPEPAIVEVERETMEQLAGHTVTIEYRDVYGIIIEASEMWLIWMP